MSVLNKIQSSWYANQVPYTKETRAARRQRDTEIYEEFWRDVYQEFNAERYPKTAWKKLRDLAWDQGRSGGFREVLSWVEELTPLLDAMLTSDEGIEASYETATDYK
jgi:hypothetical protein